MFTVRKSWNCRVLHIQHNLNLKDEKNKQTLNHTLIQLTTELSAHFLYSVVWLSPLYIYCIHPYFANKSISNAAPVVCEQWESHRHTFTGWITETVKLQTHFIPRLLWVQRTALQCVNTIHWYSELSYATGFSVQRLLSALSCFVRLTQGFIKCRVGRHDAGGLWKWVLVCVFVYVSGLPCHVCVCVRGCCVCDVFVCMSVFAYDPMCSLAQMCMHAHVVLTRGLCPLKGVPASQLRVTMIWSRAGTNMSKETNEGERAEKRHRTAERLALNPTANITNLVSEPSVCFFSDVRRKCSLSVGSRLLLHLWDALSQDT